MITSDDVSSSSPELDEDASIQSEATDSDNLMEDGSVNSTKKPKDAMGISSQSIEIVDLKGGDDDSVGLNDVEPPKKRESMKRRKLPWLDSSGSETTGQDRSVSAHGMSVGTGVSGMTGMDASFATMNFDAVSIDTENVSVRSHDPADNEEINDKDLEENLADQGINLTIQVETDEKSLSEISELSMGNESYILDLAGQKEAREKHLKEEVLEEAVTLYKEGKKEGHRGRSFFLMILTEVRKKKLETKKQHYKLQDERLDCALEEELQRRQLLTEGLSGTSTHSTGQRSRSERVDNFIEREKERKRKSLNTIPPTREEAVVAASDVKIEMHEDGEYDWGDGDDSDESLQGSKTIERKKKKKTSTSKKSKKSKEEKSGRKSGKPKKSKSNLSSNGTPDFEGSQISGMSGRKKRNAGGTRPKKNKSNMSSDGMSDLGGSQLSGKSGRKEKIRGSTKPKKNKSNMSSEGTSDFEGSQHSGKKQKKSAKKKLKKKSSKQSLEEVDSPQKTKKAKKAKSPKKSKKEKTADKKSKEKEDESPPDAISATEASDAVKGPGESDNVTVLELPHAKQKADETVHDDTNGETKIEQTTYLPLHNNETPDAPSETMLRRSMARIAAKANKMQPTRKLSGMMSAILGKKKDSSIVKSHDPPTAKEKPSKGGFFRRRKQQEESIDPGDRLLPLPGSQLGSIDA